MNCVLGAKSSVLEERSLFLSEPSGELDPGGNVILIALPSSVSQLGWDGSSVLYGAVGRRWKL